MLHLGTLRGVVMRLNEVRTGQLVRIKEIFGQKGQHDRLRDLGVRPGIEVRLLRRLLFGGVVIEVGQGFLALSSEEANLLAVEG